MPRAVVKTQIYPIEHVLQAVTVPKHSRILFYVVREPTLINSNLLRSVLVHSAALLSTHASVSQKPRHRQYYDTRYDTGRTEIPFGPFDVGVGTVRSGSRVNRSVDRTAKPGHYFFGLVKFSVNRSGK
jgi:hypothetical protein